MDLVIGLKGSGATLVQHNMEPQQMAHKVAQMLMVMAYMMLKIHGQMTFVSGQTQMVMGSQINLRPTSVTIVHWLKDIPALTVLAALIVMEMVFQMNKTFIHRMQNEVLKKRFTKKSGCGSWLLSLH